MPARHAASRPTFRLATALATALAIALAAGDGLAAPAKRAHVAVGGRTVATCLGPSLIWDPAVSRCFPVSPSASVGPRDYVRWVIDVSAGAGAMGLLPVQVVDTLTAPQLPVGAGTLAVPSAAGSGWTVVGPPAAGSPTTLATWAPPAPVASGRMPFNYGSNELWAFPAVGSTGLLETVLLVPDPAAQRCGPAAGGDLAWLTLVLPSPPASAGGTVDFYTATSSDPSSLTGEILLPGVPGQAVPATVPGSAVSVALPPYASAPTFKVDLRLSGITGATAGSLVPVEVSFGDSAGAPQVCFDAVLPDACPAGTTSASVASAPVTTLNLLTLHGTAADGDYRAAGGYGGELACIPLAIAPATASAPPRGSLTFTAGGGSGAGYTWSLTAAPSGGGINATTGVYAAGAAGGVTDVVRVTDSLGNVASRSITVTAGLAILPATASVAPHGSQTFTASGGSGAGFVWTLSVNLSGGSITAGGAYTAGATAGVTDVVQVVDSLGNVAARDVTVTGGITIAPAFASAPPRGSLTFTASGGSGTGFTWSLTAAPSGGSINASTGVYTAGATTGVSDVVQVADSLGNVASRIVTVTAGVTISPAVASTPPRGSLTFTASGGSGTGFTWSLTAAPSGGSINASAGTYLAGATGGVTDVVRVVDSLGNTASRNVTVTAGVTLSPATASVAPRGTQSFSAIGGSGTGYAFSISSNGSGGTINASTGAYAAGAAGGVTDVVRVVDSLGNADTSSVTVTAGVTIAPATASVAPHGTQSFTASGGSGTGFAWSLTTNASGGSINASTGAYAAGAAGGVTDVVRVVDSLGSADTSSVTVTAGVTIAPATASVAPHGTQSFTASGGSGTGFAWSLTTNASGGSINASTGTYLAGAVGPVTDVVRVVDSLGNVATRNVTVTATVTISPASVTLPPGGSQILTASGGSGTGFAWSLATNASGGSVNASTGAYTAGLTGSVTDVVQVTDSLGNTSTRNVTVTAAITISPASAAAPPRGSLAFTASGGSGTGFTWALATNASGGSVNASSGAYVAGATGGVTDVVRVTDSLGNLATRNVTVSGPVAIAPATASAPPRGSLTFTASGGSGAGFIWALATNASGGSINASSGAYLAGATGGVTDVVRVTDSLGNTDSRNVIVSTAVAIAPGALGIPPRGSQTFTASGGSGSGYSWSVSGTSGGRISAAGSYTAGSVEGTDLVRVTDSLGNTATATVTVTGHLSITASSTTTPPRGPLTFSGAGGSGTGFAWSLATNASGGTISAAGAYTAGATPGVTDVVQLTDSLGNTVTLAVAVGPGVSIAPPVATVLATGSQGFTAAGGSGTGFTWSLATNASGGTISATGAYTAGSTGGVADVVQVTDSLGNTATRSVTVVALPRLSLAKSGPASLAAGAAGDFTVTVTNQGGSITTGTIAFLDTLPAGLTFVRQAAGSSLACTATATGLVTCSGAPAVAAGASLAVTYTVSAAPGSTGTLTNSALVSAAGGDPRPLPPACAATTPPAGAGSVSDDGLCARWSSAVRSGTLSVQLALARVNLQAVPAGYQVGPGDLLEYAVQVTETSGQGGGAATVRALVPEATRYAGLGQGWTSECAGPGSSCSHDFALAAGRTTSVLFTVQAAAVLPDGLRAVTDAVAVQGAGVSCPSCSVTTPTVPKLALSMTSPPLLPLGGSSVTTFNIENRGGSATSGPVAFLDALPEGLTFASQIAGAPDFTCSASERSVVCTGTPAIAPGGSAEVSIGVAVGPHASGDLTSTASFTALGGDPRAPSCDAVVPGPGASSRSTDGTCAMATGTALSGDAVLFSGGATGCGCTHGRPGLEGLALAVAVLLGPALRRRRRA